MLAETAISYVVLSALVESVDESSLSQETARKNVDRVRNQMCNDKIRVFMLLVIRVKKGTYHVIQCFCLFD